jgi:hypothetical protein
MKIFIENDDTHEFLTATGGWTKNPLQGKAFSSTVAALRIGRQEAIGKFNVVCHIPQTNQLVNLQHGRGTGLPDTGGK